MKFLKLKVYKVPKVESLLSRDNAYLVLNSKFI